MKKTLILYIFLFISQICVGQAKINLINNCPLILSDVNYQENEFIKEAATFLKDSEIVAMGEASHGASEFFTMRINFFKYLVENQGYRVFAIESTLATTYDLNKYLINGKGDAKSALSKLDNFYWYTEEVLELIEWIYEFNNNKEVEEKIWFYGIDINSLYPSVQAISQYLNKVESEKENKYPNLSKLLLSKSISKEELKLEDTYSKHSDDYIGKTAKWEYDFIKQCFFNVRQTKVNRIFSNEYRDSCQAENVAWIKEITDSKIFIWAHNYHISKYQIGNNKSMGYFLNEKYKDKYYNIGFDFKKGDIWAKKGSNVLTVILNGNKNRTCKTNPPKPNTFTHLLGQLNYPVIFMEVNKCKGKNTDLDHLLDSEQKLHYSDEWFSKRKEYKNYNIRKSFDALIYIEKVTPTKHFRLGK